MSEIDDLEQIEFGGQQSSDLVLSNVYTVRIGGFGLNPNIRTFLTTLTVSELEQDVEFYEKLSTNKDWPISQIIQREVDSSRVSSISQKYLLGEGRLVKYFPPIIIALIPRDANGDFVNVFNYDVDLSRNSKEAIIEKSKYRNNQKLKELLLEKVNDSLVNGVYLFNGSQVFEHNLFCWDKNKFYAVVIDGQHRLDALIKSKSDNSAFALAKQDVVFIDASSLIPTDSALNPTPVEILRSVFIDINTNAKSVSLVRRVLMDDKDLASLCVQSLIEAVNSDGTSKEQGEYIPSMIIDWYGESMKHELPHISGVLTLYQIISDELVTDRLVTIDDHRNQQKIRRFIDLLNQYFFVDTQIQNKAEYVNVTTLATSFEEYLKEKEITLEIFSQEVYQEDLDSILFNYDYRTLEIAQDIFEKYYAKPLVNLSLTLTPYSLAIDMLKENGAFDNSTSFHKILLQPKRKWRRMPNLRDRFLEVRQSMTSALNPEFFLFYSVVGQKGVFKYFFERLFESFDYGITPELIVDIQSTCTTEVNRMISYLKERTIFIFGIDPLDLTEYFDERLLEFGTVATIFWEGILYEDERIIYNTQGVKAFSDVLRFLIDATKAAEMNLEFNIDNYQIRFSTNRTRRLLVKRFGNRSDNEFDEIADQILKRKKQIIWELLIATSTNEPE